MLKPKENKQHTSWLCLLMPPEALFVHARLSSHSVDKQGNTKLAAPTYWGQCFYSLPARIPTLLPRSSSWLIKITANLLPRTESDSVTLLCVPLFLYIVYRAGTMTPFLFYRKTKAGSWSRYPAQKMTPGFNQDLSHHGALILSY